MPFDTRTISILESEKLMANAPWIERYLIGIAYNAFARPNISPSYDILDQNTASYDMPSVVNRLNAELKKLGFNRTVPQCRTMPDLIQDLRSILMYSKRANALDWLVGNKNETFWEKAKEKEVWLLDDEALISFCVDLSAEIKAKAQE